jgi:hypothetical protein
MTFATGSWGEDARARSRKRTAYFLEYRRKHKKQWDARYMVEQAVKRGFVKKEKCRDCGIDRVNAHHPDYNFPLAVIWLCPVHHREEHKRTPSINKT